MHDVVILGTTGPPNNSVMQMNYCTCMLNVTYMPHISHVLSKSCVCYVDPTLIGRRF